MTDYITGQRIVIFLWITIWQRELRPLVIARKIRFASQSDAGAKTREILMTVLHTLKKRTPDVTVAFKSALDKIAEQADIDPNKAIFSFDSS